jgi:hypothetical protein
VGAGAIRELAHSGSESHGYKFKYDIRADIKEEHRINHNNAVAHALDQVETLVKMSTQDVENLRETILDTTADIVGQVRAHNSDRLSFLRFASCVGKGGGLGTSGARAVWNWLPPSVYCAIQVGVSLDTSSASSQPIEPSVRQHSMQTVQLSDVRHREVSH